MCRKRYVRRISWLICLITHLALDFREACGGPNRLSVYSGNGTVVALPVPVAQQTDLPGSWTYAGCLRCEFRACINSSRLLMSCREPTTTKMFPNQIIWPGNNSAVACMNQCAAFGYPASGVEVSFHYVMRNVC